MRRQVMIQRLREKALWEEDRRSRNQPKRGLHFSCKVWSRTRSLTPASVLCAARDELTIERSHLVTGRPGVRGVRVCGVPSCDRKRCGERNRGPAAECSG